MEIVKKTALCLGIGLIYAVYFFIQRREPLRLTVVVLPPSASSSIPVKTVRELASVMVAELSDSEKFGVVAQRQAQKVLKKHTLSYTRNCDLKCQMEIGKTFHSKWVISSDLNNIGPLHAMTVKILNVATETVQYEDERQCIGAAGCLMDRTKTLTQRMRAFLEGLEAPMKVVGKKETVKAGKTEKKQPATIHIISMPPGASVYVNTAYKGETPIKFIEVPADTYQLMLKKEDYRDFLVEVKVLAGEEKKVHVTLKSRGNEIKQISAGSYHTCVLTFSGKVKCWGWNFSGQLGDGTTTARPVPTDVVRLPKKVASITAGDLRACAQTAQGGLICWGFPPDPVNVESRSKDVASLVKGLRHTCVLTKSGGVQCWGRNEYGQLGNGTQIYSQTTPTDVVGVSHPVTAIVAGSFHTCLLTWPGEVKCWGRNDFGQLGDGTSKDRYTPVEIPVQSGGVIALAAGEFHTCALISSGGVKCWGGNASGQIGDGTNNNSYIPVNVVGLSEGIVSLVAGKNHTCVLTSTGRVQCWGDNRDGLLGIGTSSGPQTCGKNSCSTIPVQLLISATQP